MLDLATEPGREALEGMLGTTDFLIQNFKASSLAKLGLDPTVLSHRFPELIHLHLQGFLSDPDRPGYDMVVQAETGLMHMNGEPDRSPFRMPVAMMDILAAHQMRSAALLALWEREKDQRGSYAEIWLDASGMSALVNRGTEFLVAGNDPQPLGAEHPQIAPYGETFVCACGGKVVMAVGNERQFLSLCQLLDANEWAEDARFSTNPMRVRYRRELAERLTVAIGRMNRDPLLRAARERGIPIGRLNRVSEALAEPTGKAMTAEFDAQDQTIRHVRQVAFRIQRNGNLTT